MASEAAAAAAEAPVPVSVMNQILQEAQVMKKTFEEMLLGLQNAVQTERVYDVDVGPLITDAMAKVSKLVKAMPVLKRHRESSPVQNDSQNREDVKGLELPAVMDTEAVSGGTMAPSRKRLKPLSPNKPLTKAEKGVGDKNGIDEKQNESKHPKKEKEKEGSSFETSSAGAAVPSTYKHYNALEFRLISGCGFMVEDEFFTNTVKRLIERRRHLIPENEKKDPKYRGIIDDEGCDDDITSLMFESAYLGGTLAYNCQCTHSETLFNFIGLQKLTTVHMDVHFQPTRDGEYPGVKVAFPNGLPAAIVMDMTVGNEKLRKEVHSNSHKQTIIETLRASPLVLLHDLAEWLADPAQNQYFSFWLFSICNS